MDPVKDEEQVWAFRRTLVLEYGHAQSGQSQEWRRLLRSSEQRGPVSLLGSSPAAIDGKEGLPVNYYRMIHT